MIKTKIICTLGPALDDENMMRKLLQSGFDCARMNFSHGSHEEHSKRLALFRKVRKELGLSTAVLLDTKGPEIRTGNFEGKIDLIEDDDMTIVKAEVMGTQNKMSTTYPELYQDVKKGDAILIDDGLIALRVDSIEQSGDIICTVQNGGTVSSKKSINVPGAEINLPPLTEQDTNDILFAIKNDYDFIAVSFVRKASDVLAVKKILDHNGGSNIHVIAKIESQQGIDNFDAILHVSDGIMVARGDLGVEIPVEQVPIVQKSLIKKCNKASKPIITATQMLDSMIRNPRPTRAEASDIANAIFDETSCIMLSGETANGKYPIESLQTMRRIAENTENSINYWGRFRKTDAFMESSVTDAISNATCTTAMSLSAKAIVTVSTSGSTARHISRYRPQCPIVCATTSKKAMHQLQITWGVQPSYEGIVNSTDELFEVAVKAAKKSNVVNDGDVIIITAGVPVGVSGTTNMLKVQTVGDVLCTGRGVSKGIATGVLYVAANANDALKNFTEGQILVLKELDESLLPLLRNAIAVILESDDELEQATTAGLTLDIPVLVSSVGATQRLKSGTIATVNATIGIVHNKEK